MNVPEPERAGRTGARPWRVALTAVCGAAAVLAVTLAVFAGRTDRMACRLLDSPDPEERKQGAWLAARERAPDAQEDMARRLRERRERDAGVREAFAYALGRSADAAYFDVLAALVRSDEEAYVRQAAWVAAARVDARRFRELAAAPPPRDEPWDQIGLAAAWLEIGELSGARVLLRWAGEGDPQQCRVASLALYRGVAPLLEAVGRWPLQSTIREGVPWPAELVREVTRRCETLDLPALAADTRPHLAHAAGLRRDVARLTSLRERAARFLGAH